MQVWQTHLSEKEREYLMQFLPKGSDAEDVVQALLAGDNFHFGNPFLKWQVLFSNDNFFLKKDILWGKIMEILFEGKCWCNKEVAPLSV